MLIFVLIGLWNFHDSESSCFHLLDLARYLINFLYCIISLIFIYKYCCCLCIVLTLTPVLYFKGLIYFFFYIIYLILVNFVLNVSAFYLLFTLPSCLTCHSWMVLFLLQIICIFDYWGVLFSWNLLGCGLFRILVRICLCSWSLGYFWLCFLDVSRALR